MEKVVTTTGIKAPDLTEIAKSKLAGLGTAVSAALTREELAKKPPGRYIFKTESGDIKVFSVVEVDLAGIYKAQSAEDKFLYWRDGYKIGKIHAETHPAVRAALGLVAETRAVKAVAEAVAEANNAGVANAISLGLPLEQVKRLFPTVPAAVVDGMWKKAGK